MVIPVVLLKYALFKQSHKRALGYFIVIYVAMRFLGLCRSHFTIVWYFLTKCLLTCPLPPMMPCLISELWEQKTRAEESKTHINTAKQELCSNVKLPNKWDWKTLWGIIQTLLLSSIKNIAMRVHTGLGQTASLSISLGGIKVYLWPPRAGIEEDWQTWK